MMVRCQRQHRCESASLQTGALHLHPISKFNQLRTSLAYLDDYDAKPLTRRSHNDDDDDQPAVKKPPPKAATPATQQRILKVSYRALVCLATSHHPSFRHHTRQCSADVRTTRTMTEVDLSKTSETKCGRWRRKRRKTNGCRTGGTRLA